MPSRFSDNAMNNISRNKHRPRIVFYTFLLSVLALPTSRECDSHSDLGIDHMYMQSKYTCYFYSMHKNISILDVYYYFGLSLNKVTSVFHHM